MTWRIYHHPSEPEGSKPIQDGEEKKEDAGESVAVPIDPTAQIQADLKAAKAESAEWQDRFLRKAAEFENYRKRADKDKTDSIMLARSSVILEFLPIADACERALKSFGNPQDKPEGLAQYQAGVELLYKQLLDTLARLGVVPMEAEGKQFDPHLHEALSREETKEVEENTVTEVLRSGYHFKDKLLRPAQVRVAVRPKGQDKSS
jgi:molecular chaperone GrpE